MLPLFGELVKGFGYVRKVLDELPVEIDEPNEQLDLSDIPWGRPIADAATLTGSIST